VNLSLLRRCLALGVVLVLAGCARQRPTAEAPPLAVTIAQLKEGKALDYEDYTGRTAAVDSVDLKPRATGYLDKVLFKDGDDIKKDQLLYVVDKRLYKAAVDNAKGALARVEATLENADADLARARRMGLGNAISREDYDKIVASKRQASADLISTKAQLEQALLNLSFCDVISPITGRLSRTKLTVGNLVTADQTSLVTIVSLDPIWAYFDVDERAVLRVQRMMREEISEAGITEAGNYLRQRKVDGATVKRATLIIRNRVNDASRVQLSELLQGKIGEAGVRDLFALLAKYPRFISARETTVPVYLATQIEKGYPHQGVIDFVDNRLDSTTGTLRLRGRFPNKGYVLTPDLFVRIRLPLGDPYPAILVSDAIIVTDQDRKFLYVVNDKSEVEQRPVTLGPLRGGLRVIQSGVQEGEWVVVEGLQRVRAGSKVKADKGAMPAPPRREDFGPAPAPIIGKKGRP
jgi:RND family efflux transporter MFP subunit